MTMPPVILSPKFFFLPPKKPLIPLFFFVNISTIKEPTSYLEASKDPIRAEAMNKKLQALEDNETWFLTTLPHGHKHIQMGV